LVKAARPNDAALNDRKLMWLAATTVREFVEGRGTEVGGGDGLGMIILPRPLPEPVIDEVMRWPE
jgi:hypothetical protein